MPATGETDHSLCARAAAGNRAAFSELVARHENRVRAFLGHLSGADEADDLAQDAFVKAWLSISRFRAESQFASWVCSIAYRCFLDSKRRERSDRMRSEALAEVAPSAQGMDDSSYEIRQILMQIDPDKRAAIVLCEGHGWSHGEAAEIMGVPVGTLKSWIKRGKDQCRALMAERQS